MVVNPGTMMNLEACRLSEGSCVVGAAVDVYASKTPFHHFTSPISDKTRFPANSIEAGKRY